MSLVIIVPAVAGDGGKEGARPRRPSGRLGLAVLLCLAGLALAVGLAVVVADDDTVEAGSTRSAPRPAPLANVQVGEETDQSVIQSASSPALAANPTNPRNMVLGHRIERPTYSCAVAASFDGGRSWEPATLSLPPGSERCYTTSLAFDGQGTVHLAFVTLAGPGNVPSAVWVTRSADGGRTFQPATKVLDKERFMVRLAVDPRASPPTVFLTWVEAAGVGLLQMIPPSSVMAAVSTDGGATFAPPVRVSQAARELVGAPVPAVGRDGALHVLFYDYRGDVFDFQNLPGGRYEDTFELVLATSTDRGATFAESRVDGDIRPPESFLVFTPPFPALAVDGRSGRLYAAWSDARADQPAVLLSSSADQGRTWSGPRRVDDGSGQALLPQVAVAEDGRLDVAYASVGPGAGGPTQVRLTSSRDGGRTFGPAQPLNEPFRRDLLPVSARRDAGPDLGSTLALVSQRSQAYVAWPDTRKGSPETLRADIVGAPVRVTATARARRLLPLA